MDKHILVFCAHSDDEAVGMGGTIAKYIKEGKKVVKIVFSYGEKSHPHLHEFFVARDRIQETREASEFFGIEQTTFIGLSDLSLKKTDDNTTFKIKKEINRLKPEKIFCPSANDPHPDHRNVLRVVDEVLNGLKQDYELLTYEVWNVVDENRPAFYIDISPYYKKKVEYMKKFKSQWLYMYFLLPIVHFRCRRYGRIIGKKFAEKFYKIR